jgi:hypothetical protein
MSSSASCSPSPVLPSECNFEAACRFPGKLPGFKPRLQLTKILRVTCGPVNGTGESGIDLITTRSTRGSPRPFDPNRASPCRRTASRAYLAAAGRRGERTRANEATPPWRRMVRERPIPPSPLPRHAILLAPGSQRCHLGRGRFVADEGSASGFPPACFA